MLVQNQSTSKGNSSTDTSDELEPDPNLVVVPDQSLFVDPSLINPYELRTQWLTTIQHCFHVEYYVDILKIGNEDPQRPHDLVGEGNRLQFKVIGPLSMQHRFPEVDPEISKIFNACNYHRKHQIHHQRYNGPDPNDRNKPCSLATEDSMLLGSLDAFCAISENRKYNQKEIGPVHNYEDVEKALLLDPPHKIPYHLKLIPILMKLPRPDLSRIVNPYNIPNIGVPDHVYNAIQEISKKSMKEIKDMFRIIIPKN